MTIRPERPRLWLTPERLAWLKANPRRLEWTRLLVNCEEGFRREAAGLPLSYDSALNYALVYRVTGSLEHARFAKKLCQLYIDRGIDALLKTGATSPYGFGARIVLPEVGVGYDWLYPTLTAAEKKAWADQLMVWCDWVWQETAPPDPTRKWWSQNNPGDNFYLGYLMSLVAAIAVWPDHPRAQVHVDLGLKKLAALDAYLFKYAPGGYSLEGTNYGTWIRHGMLLAALSTATDYAQNAGLGWNFLKDAAASRWQVTAPDRKHLVPFGGQPVGADAPVIEDHTAAPLVALSHGDAATKAIAKGWYDSVTFTRKRQNSWMPALWYDNRVRVDVSQRPLVYHAPGAGYVSMRSSWERDATWVTFICGPVKESHQDYAAGAFCIYKEGEWLTGPARVWGLGGEMLPSEFCNVLLVKQGDILRGQPGQVSSGALPKDDMRIIVPPHTSNGITVTVGEAGQAYSYYKSLKVWRVLEEWSRSLTFTPPNKLMVVDYIRKVDPADELIWQLHCKQEPYLRGDTYGILGNNASLEGNFEVQGGVGRLAVGRIYKGKGGVLSSHKVELHVPGGQKEVTITNTLEIVT